MATWGETPRPWTTARPTAHPALLPDPAHPAAPVALFLHGQPGGGADWDAVVRRLDGRVAAIANSRPGWSPGTRPTTLAGNATAALGELDARDIDRAVVVGHSLGGAVAAWLAAAHPDRVAALVLVAPAANLAALSRLDRWLAAPVVAELTSAAVVGGLGIGLTVPPLRRRIARLAGIDEAYLRTAPRTALRPSAWRAYADEQRTLVNELPALDRVLGTISAPTTILAGDRDRVVPVGALRELSRQIPGARLVVRAGAGHLLPHRAPELVADAIVAALAPVAPATLGGG
jgi:pimeloyl-ACP methyl ester carboxylesterase